MPHLKIEPDAVDRVETSGIVLDPCCGSGAILDVAAESGFHTCGIELSPERSLIAGRTHSVKAYDTLASGCEWPHANALVTNPPYSLALPIIQKALMWKLDRDIRLQVDLAFLLRINFLGSQDRHDFHKKWPSDLYVLPRRPSFVMSVSCKRKRDCGWGVVIPYRPDGVLSRDRPVACEKCQGPVGSSSSDATEYAWFVWGPGRVGRVYHLDV